MTNPRRRASSSDATMDLRHLRREARTALELAVVALAPEELVDELAATAGLLEALVELPVDSPPAVATGPRVLERGRKALAGWEKWRRGQRQKIPRV